jgi:hypothetical protein
MCVPISSFFLILRVHFDILSYGVMVAQQILVLLVRVQILVGQLTIRNSCFFVLVIEYASKNQHNNGRIQQQCFY